MNVNQSLHFKKYGVFIEALWKFRAPQLKLDTMTAVREKLLMLREKWRRTRIVLCLVTSVGMGREPW